LELDPDEGMGGEPGGGAVAVPVPGVLDVERYDWGRGEIGGMGDKSTELRMGVSGDRFADHASKGGEGGSAWVSTSRSSSDW
jgi:hypothetical protein